MIDPEKSIFCPICNSFDLNKSGKSKATKIQRYICKSCEHQFVEKPAKRGIKAGTKQLRLSLEQSEYSKFQTYCSERNLDPNSFLKEYILSLQ
jgi:uncharacterized protein YlaI